MSDIHGLKVDFHDGTHKAEDFLKGMKGEHAKNIFNLAKDSGEQGYKIKAHDGNEYRIKEKDGEFSVHQYQH